MSVYIIRKLDGTELGPLEGTDIRAHLALGKLSPWVNVRILGTPYQPLWKHPDFADATFCDRPLSSVVRADSTLALRESLRLTLQQKGAVYGGAAILYGIIFGLPYLAEYLRRPELRVLDIWPWLIYIAKFVVWPLLVVGYNQLILRGTDGSSGLADLLIRPRLIWPSLLTFVIKFVMFLAIFAVIFIFSAIVAVTAFVGQIDGANFTGSTSALPSLHDLLLLSPFILAGGIAFLLVIHLYWFVEYLIADLGCTRVFPAFKLSAQMAWANLRALARIFSLFSMVQVPGLVAWIYGYSEHNDTLVLVGQILTAVACIGPLPWILMAFTHLYRQIQPKGAEL